MLHNKLQLNKVYIILVRLPTQFYLVKNPMRSQKLNKVHIKKLHGSMYVI